jgi:hypothetical protein
MVRSRTLVNCVRNSIKRRQKESNGTVLLIVYLSVERDSATYILVIDPFTNS